ncbi:MAG: hypothetical protein JKY80_00845 [Mariprofundaceae bacterium]|nr:hypothetical protein [Mariprofundaceae bacterium]
MSDEKLYNICDLCRKEFEVNEYEAYQRVCCLCEDAEDCYAEQREDERLMAMCVPEDHESR